MEPPGNPGRFTRFGPYMQVWRGDLKPCRGESYRCNGHRSKRPVQVISEDAHLSSSGGELPVLALDQESCLLSSLNVLNLHGRLKEHILHRRAVDGRVDDGPHQLVG